MSTGIYGNGGEKDNRGGSTINSVNLTDPSPMVTYLTHYKVL